MRKLSFYGILILIVVSLGAADHGGNANIEDNGLEYHGQTGNPDQITDYGEPPNWPSNDIRIINDGDAPTNHCVIHVMDEDGAQNDLGILSVNTGVEMASWNDFPSYEVIQEGSAGIGDWDGGAPDIYNTLSNNPDQIQLSDSASIGPDFPLTCSTNEVEGQTYGKWVESTESGAADSDDENSDNEADEENGEPTDNENTQESSEEGEDSATSEDSGDGEETGFQINSFSVSGADDPSTPVEVSIEATPAEDEVHISYYQCDWHNEEPVNEIFTATRELERSGNTYSLEQDFSEGSHTIWVACFSTRNDDQVALESRSFTLGSNSNGEDQEESSETEGEDEAEESDSNEGDTDNDEISWQEYCSDNADAIGISEELSVDAAVECVEPCWGSETSSSTSQNEDITCGELVEDFCTPHLEYNGEENTCSEE